MDREVKTYKGYSFDIKFMESMEVHVIDVLGPDTDSSTDPLDTFRDKQKVLALESAKNFVDDHATRKANSFQQGDDHESLYS